MEALVTVDTDHHPPYDECLPQEGMWVDQALETGISIPTDQDHTRDPDLHGQDHDRHHLGLAVGAQREETEVSFGENRPNQGEVDEGEVPVIQVSRATVIEVAVGAEAGMGEGGDDVDFFERKKQHGLR